jgi:UDP-N-acetylglucosamine--dolichyl-phosphate N-acetylglucosaminephosphotransferase
MTITLVGFIDDLFTGKQKNKDVHGDVNFRIGLRQRTKALMVIPAAIPLMVINAGHSMITLPFFGAINLGIFYPLFAIPLAVICVSNAVNMLAGINGIEAGMSATALYGLGVFAFMIGSWEAAAIALIGAVAFTAFLAYNWYPAKVFPGDSGTYLAGGLIATAVIVGNMEKFGIIIFIPWIIEAFIKLKGHFKGTCFGKLNKEGFIKPKNDKIESLTHVVMNAGNFREWQVSAVFILIEAAFVALAFGLYFMGALG